MSDSEDSEDIIDKCPIDMGDEVYIWATYRGAFHHVVKVIRTTSGVSVTGPQGETLADLTAWGHRINTWDGDTSTKKETNTAAVSRWVLNAAKAYGLAKLGYAEDSRGGPCPVDSDILDVHQDVTRSALLRHAEGIGPAALVDADIG